MDYPKIVESRLKKSNKLLQIVQEVRWVDLTSYFLGIVLSHLDPGHHTSLIHTLIQQFSSIREQLVVYRQIKPTDISYIVVDLLEEIEQLGSMGRKEIEYLQQLLYNDYAGTLQNKRYVLDKWHRLDRENQDQKMIMKMLQEEEAVQAVQMAKKEKEGWECQVCLCQIDPLLMGILQCGHIFHPECLNAHLKALIQDNNLDIKCPLEKCRSLMPPNDIYQFIDGDLRDKFQKFSFNKFVESNTVSVSWCPTPGCTAVFQFDQALDNYRCPACKKHYCLRCRCEFHTGMSCAEYRINNSFDKNDEKFIDFVRGAKFKQCPKCKYWVQRNDGCSTMKCKCGQEFCYDCGGTGCPHGRCTNSSGAKKR